MEKKLEKNHQKLTCNDVSLPGTFEPSSGQWTLWSPRSVVHVSSDYI